MVRVMEMFCYEGNIDAFKGKVLSLQQTLLSYAQEKVGAKRSKSESVVLPQGISLNLKLSLCMS